MDRNEKSLLELFNILLENLGLQQNIYGYILSITLLTILLAFKLFILNCIARHFVNCKRSHFQIEDLDIWNAVHRIFGDYSWNIFWVDFTLALECNRNFGLPEDWKSNQIGFKLLGNHYYHIRQNSSWQLKSKEK